MISRKQGVALVLAVAIAAGVALVSFKEVAIFLGLWSDGIAESLAREDQDAWVTVLDPDRASPGYTLDIYSGRLPILIDLAGRVVHSWPEVRGTARARLEPNGHLLLTNTRDEMVEYDWDGRLLFRYAPPDGHRLHHDLIRLQNGNVLALAQIRQERAESAPRAMTDYLVEVSPAGEVVWTWFYEDHRGRFPTWNLDDSNPTHTNSVFELRPNRHFDAGDARFRPGNLLVSARNLDTVFIIDRPTNEVVWQLSGELDFQHEPSMIPEGHPHAGRILVFNNGLGNRHAYRRSRIQIFDPLTLEKVWEYDDPYFYSSVAGVAQALPNGNVLIGSSRGGRAFEITLEGDIVWQWEPSRRIMRPFRYARDYAPQLAALEWIEPMAARRRAEPFVDQALYAFLLPTERSRELPEWDRPALRELRACRSLLSPPNMSLRLDYGLDREMLDGRSLAARFVAELRDEATGAIVPILNDEVRSDQEDLQRSVEVSLADRAMRPVRLCLDARLATEVKGSIRKAVVWLDPRISGEAAELAALEAGYSREERALRERQLRELGYIQ